MLHSLADFAQVCHVSKPAITQAVKRGLIIRGTDGKIDDIDPVNAIYLGGKTGAVKKQAPAGGPGAAPKKGPRKAKTADADKKAAADFTALVLKTQAKRGRNKEKADDDNGEDSPDPESGDDDIRAFMEAFLKEGGQAVLLIKKLKADIAYKEAATSRYALEMETKKGNLVEKARLVNLVTKINKALSDNIHQQHAKTGPMVFALATREGATELDVTRKLEVDYGNALRRTIEEITNAN
jgi:hypothetical protein